MAGYVPGKKNMYVKFGSTVLSGDFRSFDADETIDLVEETAGNDSAKKYLAAQADGTATLDLVDQAGGTSLWEAVAPGTEGTLEWGPEGTAVGKPKHTVNAIVRRRRRRFPYNDVVVITVDFQFSGAVTDGAY